VRACEYKPGDRIVNTSFGNPHEGVGGTVIETRWYPNTPHEVSAGAEDHGIWELIIILDTAESLTIRHTHNWVTEEDYRTGSYIPF